MHPKTRIRSLAIRHFASAKYSEKRRDKARALRKKQRAAPTVHYFHQVDDPYSHLTVQKLDELQAQYDIAFAMHLVSAPGSEYQGSAEHFDRWAHTDAAAIASAYGVEFAPTVGKPDADAVAAVNALLAGRLEAADFAQTAVQAGQALWSGDAVAENCPVSAGTSAIAAGNQLREQLGHYQGAMFYFEGEWFWGLDRLRLLEQRLQTEGFTSGPTSLCVPEPESESLTGASGKVLLEYFPSLRSPYTAIGHQRVLDLIQRSGVTVQVRPVMPMLMRGIPAPRAKQRYIITDAAREGRVHGSPLGQIVDPFGEPVKQAFALFPGAVAQDRGMEFVTAYLQAAWCDGVDIASVRGLRQVCDAAGLDWTRLQKDTQEQNWNTLLADNLETMTTHNLWGVPSFRVSGGTATGAFACWGQDRIWRVANEIAYRT